MIFDRFLRRNRLDPKVNRWLAKQSFPEDAMLYLIEKELYEHGERDLGYVVPRKRNDEYFAKLLDIEAYDLRQPTNMALYDSIARVHTEEPEKVKPLKSKPAYHHHPHKAPEPMKNPGAVPAFSEVTKLSSVNKGRKIYNTTSSSVVATIPDEKFDHTEDLTCFDD